MWGRERGIGLWIASFQTVNVPRYIRRPADLFTGRRLLGRAGPVLSFLVIPFALVACDGEIGRTASPGAPKFDSERIADAARVAENRRCRAVPGRSKIRRAVRYARRDEGLVSFALIDRRGHSHGFEQDRPYVSASVVKVMLLVAEIRRLRSADLEVDPDTAATLEAMITVSDNDAADVIYGRVGDAGLFEVAERAGMNDFTVVGHWGNARITAADLARLMRGLEMNLAGRGSAMAMGLLASITEFQTWGIPAVVCDKYRLYFKGGWRSTDLGELVHQAAMLKGRDGSKASLAVLTDGQVSRSDAIADIETIAGTLFGESSRGAGSGVDRPDGT